MPVFVLAEFLRVVTHPRLFDPPSSRRTAVAAVSRLLASPSVQVLHPGARFWRFFCDALDDAEATGNLMLDAEIAAVCRERGVRTVLTEDRASAGSPTLKILRLDDQAS